MKNEELWRSQYLLSKGTLVKHLTNSRRLFAYAQNDKINADSSFFVLHSSFNSYF